MILKVERENIYKTANVIEPDGTVRLIPPLYFGQMIWRDRLGQYRYDKSVPDDFWTKRDFLIRRGWHQGYHFDIDWQKGDWKEWGAINTEEALKKEGFFKNGASSNAT